MKYTSALKLKLIYVMRINDEAHKGCLKIGEATSDDFNIVGLEPNSKALNQAAKKRINQYTQTAGIVYDLLYTELSIYSKNGTINSFSDTEVHKVLERSGIEKRVFDKVNKANEWFVTDLETAKNAIKAVKEGRSSLSSYEITEEQSPINFRPEQSDAISRTIKKFKNSNRMLWYAKMRFGKTLSALQVVKEQEFSRTLILTHRPVVDAGWFEDFNKIFYDRKEYRYGSKNKGDTFEGLLSHSAKKGKMIYFASMQDLRGSEQVGGTHYKNEEVFAVNWDFIIVDEAHEGTQTDLGRNVINELVKANTKVLELSGTPFNLLDEYEETEIYTWDYVMEQRAKYEWDDKNFGDPNPYASLPRMNIFTYDLGEIMKTYIDEDVAFNFREFFRVNKSGDFYHEKDVTSFLNLISKKDDANNYPYSTEEYRENFRHSLWMVPGVKEARALSSLLKSHPIFSQFEIVNVAGEGDEEESFKDALDKVRKAIGKKPHESYTITLSCGRLTTGVSVPEWTAVFMLSGSFNTSASSYMQTIFRVQTPAKINGRIKEECFVFDFAPDRTLKVIAEAAKISSQAGKTSESDRDAMGEFLNFCPIIGVDGTRMIKYNVNSMLEQLKRAYVDRVVNNGFEDGYLYNNDELMKLDDIELNEFDGLKSIIGQTRAIKKSGDIDVNRQGFTEEQYDKIEKAEKKKKKDLTDEEKKLLDDRKEKKKNRDSAISILRGISIRMPLLIYGADLKDENKELSIDNFANLIDNQSWEEFMPEGVTKSVFEKFKRYYEPDVFRAAGKKIRAMARSADSMNVEERINRISSIFTSFRNPDKETVLTPWRVVNMHMSDTLGGWSFYDDKFEETIDRPRFVNHSEVTENVFSEDALNLEINSKSGLYSLYLAYSIYRTKTKNMDALTLEEEHYIWDDVVKNNIFVICKTPMAKSIARRTLVGFRKADVNTRYFEDLINQITNKSDNFIAKVKQGKTYWKVNNNNNMKFNAIVGNPPYQVMDGGAGASAKPIYQHFISISKKIKPDYISLITPSRWFAGGKGLDEFREEMLSDQSIVKMVDYVNAKDCFPTTSIGGGINYFLWDKAYKGNCEFVSINNGIVNSMSRRLNDYPVFIRFNSAVSILEKITEKTGDNIEENMSSIVSYRNPFGFPSNKRGVKNKKENSIRLFSSEGISYLDSNDVNLNNQYINKYKVLISKVTSEHAGEPDKNGMFRILSRTEILNPGDACTDSYLVIGSTSNYDEIKALYLYLMSNFSRFLLLLAVTSINLSKDKFQFIPIQDFTSESDIDWSKPIDHINRQLYNKYDLTSDEIEFIESMIKPMS